MLGDNLAPEPDCGGVAEMLAAAFDIIGSRCLNIRVQ
jgi:hypothetical protein